MHTRRISHRHNTVANLKILKYKSIISALQKHLSTKMHVTCLGEVFPSGNISHWSLTFLETLHLIPYRVSHRSSPSVTRRMASAPSLITRRCYTQLTSATRTQKRSLSSQCLRITSTSQISRRRTQERRWQSTEVTAATNPKIQGIVDQISGLTLLETADLVSTLKVRTTANPLLSLFQANTMPRNPSTSPTSPSPLPPPLPPAPQPQHPPTKKKPRPHPPRRQCSHSSSNRSKLHPNQRSSRRSRACSDCRS